MDKFLAQIRREFHLLKTQGFSLATSRSLIEKAYDVKISVLDAWKIYNNRG